MVRIRQIRSDVTWAFKETTKPERNLCAECQLSGGPFCPKKKTLAKKYQNEMIAVRCRFFRRADAKKV